MLVSWRGPPLRSVTPGYLPKNSRFQVNGYGVAGGIGALALVASLLAHELRTR